MSRVYDFGLGGQIPDSSTKCPNFQISHNKISLLGSRPARRDHVAQEQREAGLIEQRHPTNVGPTVVGPGDYAAAPRGPICDIAIYRIRLSGTRYSSIETKPCQVPRLTGVQRANTYTNDNAADPTPATDSASHPRRAHRGT